MIWVALASMTAAAVLCTVWPMVRASAGAARSGAERRSPEAMFDVAFYRRQIAELDDDVTRGLLAAGDAAGTRVELGRRLLAAADRMEGRPNPARPKVSGVAAALVVVLVPAVALAVYLHVGAPAYRDLPLASREVGNSDMAALIGRIETHLASHPDDVRGFALIAPIYLRLARFDDAVAAYASLLRLRRDNAEDEAGYGQALAMAADGVVTAQARAAFETALKIDPAMPQARFFTGLAAAQDGDKAKARSIWQALVDGSPTDAPWLAMVRSRLATLDNDQPVRSAVAETSAGAPSGPAAAAIAALPGAERQAAIRGMVDGLAARLAQDGHDPEGWLRLVRAYAVLGEADKSRQALADARRVLASDTATLDRLTRLARELGLEG